jgi:hypothetical protein
MLEDLFLLIDGLESAEFYDLTLDEAELLDQDALGIHLIIEGLSYKFWALERGIEIAGHRGFWKPPGSLSTRQKLELTKNDWIQEENDVRDQNDLDAINGVQMALSDTELIYVDIKPYTSDPKVPPEQLKYMDAMQIWFLRHMLNRPKCM